MVMCEPDFAADHSLRQQRIANVVLEILPVEPLRGYRLFQLSMLSILF